MDESHSRAWYSCLAGEAQGHQPLFNVIMMNFIKRYLSNNQLDDYIKKITLLIRVSLYVSILISGLALCTYILSGGRLQYNAPGFAGGVAILLLYINFYLVLYVTIPSLFLLIAFHLDNKYRTKPNPQAIRKEVELLAINIGIILILAGLMIRMHFLGSTS